MPDPFDELRLDEAFVRAAPTVEASAAERLAQAGWPAPWRPRRPTDLRRWASVAAVCGLIVFTATRQESGAGGGPAVLVVGDRPPAGIEAAETPLGLPPVGRSGPHVFLWEQEDGSPVAYDPCRPIHVVVNDRQAVPEAADLLRRALADVSAATGLAFTVDGPTTEVPLLERPPYQEARYGDRWAPVLVAWSDPEEYPDLAGRVAGVGGSTPVEDPDSGDLVYVSGIVVIDGPDAFLVPPQEVLATLRHELGHLVGLDHVEDRSQLMHESGVGILDFAAGDLAGLAALGGGPCRPGV